MPKKSIINFKGIISKLARELIKDNNCVDLSNIDFSFQGAINLRKGIAACVTLPSAVRGLKRFYGSGNARNLLGADSQKIYNINTDTCIFEDISNFTQGVATALDGTAIINFAGDITPQDTGFKEGSDVSRASNAADVPNAYQSDDSRATVRSDTNIWYGSIGIRAFNFGVFIPEGAVIDGIELQVEGYKNQNTAWDKENITIGGPSETAGADIDNMTTVFSAAGDDSIENFGGASDLWGLGSIDRSTVIDFDFSIIIRTDLPLTTSGPLQFKCDSLKMKIYYTGASGIPPILENIEVGSIFSINADGTEYVVIAIIDPITFQAGATTLDFTDANPDTITRSAGSWIDDGFKAGMRTTVANATNPANNGTYTIASVTALVLTLTGAAALTTSLTDATATLVTDVAVELDSNFSGTFTDEEYTIQRVFSNNEKLDLVLVQSKNRIYGANGVDQSFEYDGSQIFDIGITAPSAPLAVDGGAGSIPDGTYKIKTTLVSEFGESNPSDEISVVLTGGGSKITITDLSIGSNKITSRNIYMTPDASDDFFFVKSVDDNFSTIVDIDTEFAQLLANEVLFSPEDHDKPPPFRYIEWHKNHLFGAEVNSNIIRFSGLDFPDHWPAFNQFKTPTGENVERIQSYGDFLAIYTRNSISILLGSNTDDFLLQGVEFAFGLTASFSVAKVPGNSHFYMSQSGIRQFTGRQSPRVSDEIERLLFDDDSIFKINRSKEAQICSIHADEKYIMSYPSIDSESNDKILLFDFLTRDWCIYDIPASVITYFSGKFDNSEIYIGDENGNVKQILVGNDDEGDDIEGSYTTKWIDFGNHEIKLFKKVYFEYFANGEAEILMTARTNQEGSEAQPKLFLVEETTEPLELFFDLPEEMYGTDIQIEVEIIGQAAVRIERFVIELSQEFEEDNSKDS